MRVNAFSAAGKFYRGNLHTHSNLSDGKLDPAEVCRRYKERGYDFICLSDHFREVHNFPIADTTSCRGDGFTTILGAECHAPLTENGDQWHILAVGLPADFPPNFQGETGPEIAKRCLDAGAFVVLPHPEWYTLTMADAAAIPEAHAVEVYNHTSHVRYAKGGGVYYLDALLNSGRQINALACDDAHFALGTDQNGDAFGGWVMVKATENEPEALLEALKAGNYYSTQGPRLEDIRIEDDHIIIETSPVSQITVLGRGSRNEKVHGAGTTSARLPLSKYAGDWCRVVAMDDQGKIAWSNPIYL